MASKIPLLCFFIAASLVQFIQTDYIAAIVELQPANGTTINETVETNLENYIYNIELAKAKSAQIIVFPEYGLTGLTPNPNGYAIEIPNPGDNTTFAHYWLQKLSNAGVDHGMYVVVNLLEMEKNAANKTIFYNTNVVFDVYGKLVAKYRKINLYQEPALTPGDPNQKQNTFTTEFGVTFGTFTCYDISFYNPAKKILENSSVTDIVFPTAWISFLPFEHSLSAQRGYAAAYNVNLLAANLNDIERGTGGSGIYGANGTIFNYYISGTPGTILKTATVTNSKLPINITRVGYGGGIEIPSLNDFKAERYFDSDKYEFKRLNISQMQIKEEICHRSFCCLFSVNVSATALNSSDIYHIMAYDGPVEFGGVTKRHARVCSLVACETPNPNTCGTRNSTTTSQLSSIQVESTVPDVFDEDLLPISLTVDLVPVFDIAFNSTVLGGSRRVSYLATNIDQQNIIAFGLIGNKSAAIGFNSLLLFVILCLNYVFH